MLLPVVAGLAHYYRRREPGTGSYSVPLQCHATTRTTTRRTSSAHALSMEFRRSAPLYIRLPFFTYLFPHLLCSTSLFDHNNIIFFAQNLAKLRPGNPTRTGSYMLLKNVTTTHHTIFFFSPSLSGCCRACC